MIFIPFECSGFASAVVVLGTLIDGTDEEFGAVNAQVSLIWVKQPNFGQAAVEAMASVEGNESMPTLSTPNIGATVVTASESGANEKFPIDAVIRDRINKINIHVISALVMS